MRPLSFGMWRTNAGPIPLPLICASAPQPLAGCAVPVLALSPSRVLGPVLALALVLVLMMLVVVVVVLLLLVALALLERLQLRYVLLRAARCPTTDRSRASCFMLNLRGGCVRCARCVDPGMWHYRPACVVVTPLVCVRS